MDIYDNGIIVDSDRSIFSLLIVVSDPEERFDSFPFSDYEQRAYYVLFTRDFTMQSEVTEAIDGFIQNMSDAPLWLRKECVTFFHEDEEFAGTQLLEDAYPPVQCMLDPVLDESNKL